MKTLATQVQEEAQRGMIVQILVEWRMEWMPFGELRLQMLRRAGYPVTDEALEFHLNYLSRAGYLETKQLRAARAGFASASACASQPTRFPDTF